jgi:hypothetical protein
LGSTSRYRKKQPSGRNGKNIRMLIFLSGGREEFTVKANTAPSPKDVATYDLNQKWRRIDLKKYGFT